MQFLVLESQTDTTSLCIRCLKMFYLQCDVADYIVIVLEEGYRV